MGESQTNLTYDIHLQNPFFFFFVTRTNIQMGIASHVYHVYVNIVVPYYRIFLCNYKNG